MFRVHDLATAIHWFVLAPAQEEALLRAYFGGEPDDWQRAKLELMKQVSWCFYAVVFLLLATEGGQTSPPAPPESAQLPGFADAVRAARAGTMSLQSPADMVRFSHIIANESLRAMARPEFAHALALLSTPPAQELGFGSEGVETIT